MEIKNNILEAIGNTPLVRLNQVSRPGVELLVKCEFMNPGGSIKDRIGAYMVEAAERSGELKPGGTIVEATSGNTGMGLALAASIKGYKSIFVMPDKMSEEKRQNLRSFGAKVVITPTGVSPDSPHSHYSVAARIAKELPGSCYMNQYHNLKNRETHYRSTGPEIFRQTHGEIDAIVVGMGTCGTISGIGKYFKEKRPSVQMVGVDPKGSILKELFETGKMPHAHTYKIEGIGEDMKPDNCDFSVVDAIVQVEDKEAFLMTRSLLNREGLFVGVSAGAAVVGALRYASEHPEAKRIVVILPDSGNRYLSKVFNDAWMIENSFLDRPLASSIGDLIRALHKNNKIVGARPEDTVEAVVRRMREEGVSQLPVFDDSGVKGVIAETILLRPLLLGTIRSTDPIESLIDAHYALVQESEPLERLTEVFTAGKVAFVSSGDKVEYILTKIDLISYLSLYGGAAV